MSTPKATMKAQAAPVTPKTETVRFECPGLRISRDHFSNTEGEEVFELRDVPYLQIDYAVHFEALKVSGVDEELASRATDKMAEFVHIQSIATMIAKRFKRVG